MPVKRVWRDTKDKPSGQFAAAGDAQTSVYVLRRTSSGAALTELFLDSSGVRITLEDGRRRALQERPIHEETGVSDPIRVAIVDDDGAFCQAAAQWMEEGSDIQVVGSAQSGQEVLAWLCQVRPDIVLMDVAAAQVLQVAAQSRVIVLHGPGQEPLALKALRAGAWGHLDRQDIRPAQVIAAVRAVGRGETVISPAVAGQMLNEVVRQLRFDRGGR